ncbi:glycosyltransferase family A protein [soil metagenome]
MKSNPLVTIVIPARYSGRDLPLCIKHIKNQSYKNIEIIVVDSNSKDKTSDVCKKNNVTLLQFDNSHLKGRFDAPYKRNLGAKQAKGEFVYYLDADFSLSKDVVKEAVAACTLENFKAVIVKEIVSGNGYWTSCRWLEQECYWGEDNVEAPRFFNRKIWIKLGGLDEALGAGCDDWDMYQRFLSHGYKAKRISSTLIHNEGKIQLIQIIKKAYLFGKDVTKFVKKSPRGGFIYFFPIRPAYIRNWRLFLRYPHLGIGLVLLRTVEYGAGGMGIIANYFNR